MKYPDAGINPAKSGLTARAGLYFNAGLHDKGDGFNLQDLDPYLLFDAETSMLGNLENPTLDLDPATPDTLDVITATRAGIATYTAADGQIVVADPNTVRVDHVQGEELTPTKYQRVRYTDIESNWNPFLGSTVEGDGLNGYSSYIFTSSGSYARPQTAVSTEDGQVYTGSFWARRVSGSGALLGWHQFSATGNATAALSVTNDWAFYSFQFLGKSGGGDINFGLAVEDSGDVVEIAMPQVEEGTTATDFVPNTTGSPKFIASATYGPRVPMMLIEPSSENLWGWSEGTISDYSTNAVLYGEGYLSDDTTSRNGLSNWIHFAPSSDTVVGFRIPVSVASGPTMILSFYVIMDDGSKPRVGTSSTGSDTDFAILLQGSSSAGVYGGVEHIGGDLYRVWAYRTFTATSNGQYIYRYPEHSGKGFKVSGVMLEESPLPTSYIPTSGSAETRQADNLVIDGTAFSDFYNGSEGTFYIESQVRDVTPEIYFLRGDATTQRFLYSNNNTESLNSWDGTTGLSLGTITDNQLFRAAISYISGSEKNASLNGSADSTALQNTNWDAPTELRIGRLGTQGQINGHIKRLIYWPTHSSNL